MKRVDEVLSERRIEPIAEVLRLLDALRRQRFKAKRPSRDLTPAQAAAFREREAAAVARLRAANRDDQLRVWMEILPYVYARPREAPEAEALPDDAQKRRLAGLTDAQLLQLVKNQTG